MPDSDVNGVELYWEHAGSGPRLLFCNGSGVTLEGVRPLLGFLAATFDLLTWDYRGFGHSAPVTRPYTTGDMAADAVCLLGIVGWSTCRVMGLSFGGMVALEFAVTNPARVERLALACTSAGGEGGSSYPLEKLVQLPPDEQAAARRKVVDSRWDDRWLDDHPPDRALAERLASSQANAPQPAQEAQLQAAQGMTCGTGSARSHARPWLPTAITTGSLRHRTAPRSRRASKQPSRAATKEATRSCSRTRPRCPHSWNFFKCHQTDASARANASLKARGGVHRRLWTRLPHVVIGASPCTARR